MNPWKPISSYRGEDRHEVDLWIEIHASPASMGFADAFRVINAFKTDGKWFHYEGGHQKELRAEYITHWMPSPRPPRKRGAQK